MNLNVIEYRSIRALTHPAVGRSVRASTDMVTKILNQRYIKGKHFICLKGDDLKAFRANGQIGLLKLKYYVPNAQLNLGVA